MRVPSTCALAVVWLACMRPSGLEALERGHEGPPVVVLLHGYGSMPEDLVGFAARTDLPTRARVLIPRAPRRIEAGQGRPGGRMWWPFPRDFRDVRALRLEGVAEAARTLDAWLERVVPRSMPLVLVGFSQGSMLAVEVAVRHPRPLAGLAILSGAPLDLEHLRRALPRRAGLAVLQAHGRSDDVLPYDHAIELRNTMRASGLCVRFVPFDGGHVADANVSTELAAFLRSVPASGARAAGGCAPDSPALQRDRL